MFPLWVEFSTRCQLLAFGLVQWLIRAIASCPCWALRASVLHLARDYNREKKRRLMKIDFLFPETFYFPPEATRMRASINLNNLSGSLG